MPRGLWRGEDVTETLPIIESLRLTPYRNPRVLQAAAEEREARASLDLALRVGEAHAAVWCGRAPGGVQRGGGRGRGRSGQPRGGHQGGITTLLGAMAVLLAIATGSTLGELLGAPFDNRMVQKRRARRR